MSPNYIKVLILCFTIKKKNTYSFYYLLKMHTIKMIVLSIVLIISLTQADLIELSHNPDDVHFYLYPVAGDKNFTEEIVFNDPNSLGSSHFQPNFKTVFIIHGFRNNYTMEMSQSVKNAYLDSGINSNYIVVDWGKLSTPLPAPLTASLYALVVGNVPIVAHRVADFLGFLYNSNSLTDFGLVHMVGHSLGAHISGLTGLYIQQMFVGLKIGRISGLDPAGPLFLPPLSCRNLVKSDATFVDVIHSNAGGLGDLTVDGHVDFYPNGGSSQPGCALLDTGIPGGDLATAGRCSHWFSFRLWNKAIKQTYTACKYSNLLQCNVFDRLGEYCSTSARGKYYLDTEEITSCVDC